ncbi:hypothetical protein SGA02_11830 [Staphylococcus gallinarum]|uniref:Uncharacterized protein n=1 Tax=Staphylococcus gallinarum TaxID=1293 RepID=A0A380FH17_STAGA|nr:hypothetical protein SGA02_11830 [Staphylococcus gallinarum]SUM33458.1 Uncharacterised protein [Staphylococcus gallinarum]
MAISILNNIGIVFFIFKIMTSLLHYYFSYIKYYENNGSLIFDFVYSSSRYLNQTQITV